VKYAVFRQMRDLKLAPWRVDDAELVAAAGACTDCPKRTSAQRTFLIEDTGDDKCTDAKCWASKEKAEGARRVDDAKKRGLKVLQGKEAEKVVTPYGSMQSGYVNLDEPCHEDPKHRTWRQVLKKNVPESAVLVPRKDAMPIEAVTRAAARKAAADGGAAWAKPDPKPATAKASASAKSKSASKGGLVDEVDIEAEIEDRVIARLVSPTPPAGLVRAVASLIAGEHPFVNLTEKRGLKGEPRNALPKFLKTATPDQCAGVIGHWFFIESPPQGDDLRAFAKEIGVDPKAVEKELRAKAAAELGEKKDDAKEASGPPKGTKPGRPEKVFKAGVVREPGWLYYTDREKPDSDVIAIFRTKMVRGGQKKKPGDKPELLLKTDVKRVEGFLYFLDKQGDVSRTWLSKTPTKKGRAA
jgi:hypothetical protein